MRGMWLGSMEECWLVEPADKTRLKGYDVGSESLSGRLVIGV